MKEWPFTIPHDLKTSLEASGEADWLPMFRTWAKKHKLRLKIQWFPELERKAGELLQWRWPPSHQDKWMTIREWLSANDVPAPQTLPQEPEIPNIGLGH